MNTITKDEVDLQYKKIDAFEKVIPGIRYGEDYPAFALAVVGSEAFKSLVTVSSMMGMISTLMVKSPPEGMAEEAAAEWSRKQFSEMIENSPVREVLLRALYLGYRLGKGEGL